MWFTYILYSSTKGKYYIGSTENIQERIRKHNTNHSGFTGKTGDWELKWSSAYSTKQEAGQQERKIKNWKSRKMIEKLITDSEHPDLQSGG